MTKFCARPRLRLKKALRTSDSAFRIGGDEFAVLLPQTDAEQALAAEPAYRNGFCRNAASLAAQRQCDRGPRCGYVPTGRRTGRPIDSRRRRASLSLEAFQSSQAQQRCAGGPTGSERIPPRSDLRPQCRQQRHTEPRCRASTAPTERNAGATKPISIESRRTPRKARIVDWTCSSAQRPGDAFGPPVAGCRACFATRVRHAAQGRTRVHDRDERVCHAG